MVSVVVGEANHELKQRQFDSVADLKPATEEEIKLFLSGKHKKMPEERKLVVRRHLKLSKEKA